MNGSASAGGSGPADRFLDDVNGLRLHYLDWGNAAAPPMLLLHGFSSSARAWVEVAGAFAGWYRVLALDHRGHGESDWDPETSYVLETFVGDLEQVVERLGLGRFTLIGHSMGAAIAMHYAARRPATITRLVLEDAGPRPEGSSTLRPEYAARPLVFASRAEAEAYLRPTLPAAVAGRSLEYGFRDLPDGTVTWRADVRGLIRSRQAPDPLRGEPMWRAVESLRCPTLLVRGGRSPVLSREVAERMAAVNPNIRLVEIPEADHWIHDGWPGELIREIERFLAE